MPDICLLFFVVLFNNSLLVASCPNEDYGNVRMGKVFIDDSGIPWSCKKYCPGVVGCEKQCRSASDNQTSENHYTSNSTHYQTREEKTTTFLDMAPYILIGLTAVIGLGAVGWKVISNYNGTRSSSQHDDRNRGIRRPFNNGQGDEHIDLDDRSQQGNEIAQPSGEDELHTMVESQI